MVARDPQGDVGPTRVPNEVGRGQAERLDERGEIRSEDSYRELGAISNRRVRMVVALTVHNHAEARRKLRPLRRPAAVVMKRAMNQDDRVAASLLDVRQLCPVDANRFDRRRVPALWAVSTTSAAIATPPLTHTAFPMANSFPAAPPGPLLSRDN